MITRMMMAGPAVPLRVAGAQPAASRSVNVTINLLLVNTDDGDNEGTSIEFFTIIKHWFDAQSHHSTCFK